MDRRRGLGTLFIGLMVLVTVCGALGGDRLIRELPENQTREAQAWNLQVLGAQAVETQVGEAAEGETRTKEAPYTLVAVGDIQLSRRVGQRIREKGWGYLFEAIQNLTDSSDIAFANLECPAALSGSPYPGKDPDVTFLSDPAALFGLKQAGFSVLSLANNHTNDYGAPALLETLQALGLLGISTCGAGASEAEAHEPAIKNLGPWSVAVLAYAEKLWSVVEARGIPPEATAGVAVIDEDRIVRDIQRAKERADLVILSLHWGEEHEGIPTETQRDLAHRLVNAGAGLIVGHHPHVVQGVEYFQGVPILYSLGNFVFDMISPRTYDSVLARITLRFSETARGERIRRSVEIPNLELVPIHIDRQTYAPQQAVGADRSRILELLAKRCDVLGTPSKVTERGTLVISDTDSGEPET